MGILRKLFEYTHNISLKKKSKEDFQEEFEKIKVMETLIKLDTLKGNNNSMSEFFIKLQELKKSGHDMNKLLK